MPELLPNYGWRLRIGVMLPSVNTVAEPQIHAMMPPGVSAHFTRIDIAGDQEHRRKADGVEASARLLADADVDLIVFHCTGVSMIETGMTDELRRRISTTTNRPATTTGDSILKAADTLGVKRIVLICPSKQRSHQVELTFLRHHGMEVVRDGCMDTQDPLRLATLQPGDLYRFAMDHRAADADAYFISCTAVRSTEVIEALEKDLQRPVLTSNQATVWNALRSGGIKDTISGYGTLLSQH